MKNSSKLNVVFGALAVVVMISGTAQAVTVSASVIIDPNGPGTFDVTLSASVGDNDGIVSYGITLLGGITGADHNSPSAVFISPGGVAPGVAGGGGFAGVRSPEIAGPGDDFFGPALIGASQLAGPLGNINLISGFGQVASSFAAEGFLVGFAGDEPQAWLAEMIVASGTWTGVAPSIDFSASSATVWNLGGFNGPQTAGSIVGTPIIPEPASVFLASIALIGIVGMRRTF